MKLKLICTLALGIGFTSSTFASSLVCASANLYSSNVRRDFGMNPPVGTVTGTNVIVYNRHVVLSATTVKGSISHGVPPYQVELVGEKTILETTGVPVSGSTTFTQTAILNKVNPLNPNETQEIAKEQVVCKNTWAFFP